MSANLSSYIPNLDRIALAALPLLQKEMKLGSYEEDEDDFGIPSDLGAATDALLIDVDELGAVAPNTPIALRNLARIRGRYTSVQNALNNLQKQAPAPVAVIRPMTNLMAAGKKLASVAGNIAAASRAQATIKYLRRPNNQTTVHVEALATATATGTFTIKAPIGGRPFRFMAMTTEVATVGSATVPPTRGPVGVGFSSFNILGQERVSNANVVLSTGTKAVAKWDFTQFSKENEGKEPEEHLNPWGIGPSGWFESDFTFDFVVRNDSGLAVNVVITFYWQASPCEDETSGRGLYRGKAVIPVQAKRSASLFRNVLAYSPHPTVVSGSDYEGAE